MKEGIQLIRKVNRKSSFEKSQHYRYIRHTKAQLAFDGNFQPMKRSKKNGVNYHPLFQWLLSKVGQNWDKVYSEACKRVPQEFRETIFYMVNTHAIKKDGIVVDSKGQALHSTFRFGEARHFKQLYVNKGILTKV
jgi:glutathione peroxidase-family protein